MPVNPKLLKRGTRVRIDADFVGRRKWAEGVVVSVHKISRREVSVTVDLGGKHPRRVYLMLREVVGIVHEKKKAPH